VALGAVTSAAEGAIVKLARLGTVSAFPPVAVDVIGCPTTVLGSGETEEEAAGSVDTGGAFGSLVSVPGGWLTGTAESEPDA
jgi:hypothetical protein